MFISVKPNTKNLFKMTKKDSNMAFYVRNDEIIPVAIPVGKRVKIGSAYIPPLDNHISNDQIWIQDIFTLIIYHGML